MVLGCGYSGLLIARSYPGDVLVVDKGRGVGGRIATRRFDGGQYDTGTPVIEGHNDLISEFLENGSLAKDSRGQFKGSPVMTSFAKSLAEGLDLVKGFKVVSLQTCKGGWRLEDQNGESHEAHRVVLTLPVPQMLDLLEDSKLPLDDTQKQNLASVRYSKQLMLLVHHDGSWPQPWPSSIAKVVDQHERGTSPIPHHNLVFFTEAFSEEHYDWDDVKLHQFMLKVLFDAGVKPKTSDLKRWKFSRVIQPYGGSSQELLGHPGLYLAGDAFGGGDLLGAERSARQVLTLLSRR